LYNSVTCFNYFLAGYIYVLSLMTFFLL